MGAVVAGVLQANRPVALSVICGEVRGLIDDRDIARQTAVTYIAAYTEVGEFKVWICGEITGTPLHVTHAQEPVSYEHARGAYTEESGGRATRSTWQAVPRPPVHGGRCCEMTVLPFFLSCRVQLSVRKNPIKKILDFFFNSLISL